MALTHHTQPELVMGTCAPSREEAEREERRLEAKRKATRSANDFASKKKRERDAAEKERLRKSHEILAQGK